MIAKCHCDCACAIDIHEIYMYGVPLRGRDFPFSRIHVFKGGIAVRCGVDEQDESRKARKRKRQVVVHAEWSLSWSWSVIVSDSDHGGDCGGWQSESGKW